MNQIPIADLIRADAFRMECLTAARSTALPDWLIVAGFVRNLIWDHLHRRYPRTPLNDVDLAYFDRTDLSADSERHIEARLVERNPEIRWQVRNQARMHIGNGHAPYRSTSDAISYFPELATCIGASLQDDGQVDIVAPHGINHSWALTIRANPKAGYPPSLVADRAAQKRWFDIWPDLRIEP
jgi:hypothetical protein